jgi:hypothetical protein
VVTGLTPPRFATMQRFAAASTLRSMLVLVRPSCLANQFDIHSAANRNWLLVAVWAAP